MRVKGLPELTTTEKTERKQYLIATISAVKTHVSTVLRSLHWILSQNVLPIESWWKHDKDMLAIFIFFPCSIQSTWSFKIYHSPSFRIVTNIFYKFDSIQPVWVHAFHHSNSLVKLFLLLPFFVWFLKILIYYYIFNS